jgi:signal transduction histidine kinase/ligand-binding sensor domain-containing protein
VRYDASSMASASAHSKVFFTLAVLLAFCPCSYSLNPALDVSQYSHKAWKVREGFSKGSVTAIAQTADGYLWLGTEFGLVRFDGVRTSAWDPPAGEHLPSVYIRSLLVARDGALWIGTAEGLASWKNGKLKLYPELAGESVDALLEDDAGVLWAGGQEAPAARLCAIQSYERTECYGQDGNFGQHVNTLREDSGGNLWVGATTGLWRWKPGAPKLFAMPPSVSGVLGLTQEEDGNLLLATGGEVRKISNGTARTYEVPVGERFTPRVLLRDANGGLWIGTTNRGLIHMHEGRADVFAQSDGLSGDFVESLFEDREGNVWVATLDGLDRFCDIAVPTISVKQGLSSATVESVLATADGSVWLGTVDGLNRLERGEKITVYRKRKIERNTESREIAAAGRVREFTDSSLPDDGIEALYQDAQQRIWVATHRGLAYFKNGGFTAISSVPGSVHSIAGDAAGNVWVSQAESLFHLKGERVVERIPWAQLGHSDGAREMAVDPLQGGLWLGFRDGGVDYFQGDRIRAVYGIAEGLGKGHVKGLRLGRDNAVWVATDGGLSRIKDGRALTLSSGNGLPCDSVHWSLEDNEHGLWVYLTCGLVRIAGAEIDAWVAAAAKEPNRKVRIMALSSSDGVRSHATTTGYSPSVAKSADGKIWFLPWDGVSVLDPHDLAFNKIPPPVHIEEVLADRKSYETSSDSELHLPPRKRDLEIDYTALSFVAPEKVFFRYKLEGHDADWQEVMSRRQAFYNNLPPGNYHFRVAACNNSGVWNEAGASIDFAVAPAYYQTIWFRVLCVAALLGLLLAIYHLRVRQLAQEFDMRLEARVGERTRIARELHDTLLQGVQGLILQFHAIAKRIPGNEPARQMMEKAMDRADQVLAEGRDRVRNLRQTSESLSDLPAALQRVAEETPQGAETTFKAVVEGTVRDLNPLVLEESYGIGREALVNALTHSGGLNVEAEIIYDPREFRLRIRDDGRGIAPGILEKGGRTDHWGLQGMRERAGRIGAHLQLWSRPGMGTEVELKVPSETAYRNPRGRRKIQWFRRPSSADSEDL